MTAARLISSGFATPVDAALETVERSRALVICGHVALAGELAALTVAGWGTFPVEHPVVGAIGSIGLLVAQLALAAGPGGKRGWVLYAVVLGLSVGLLPVLGTAWLASLWFAGAASVLQLPRRAALVGCTALLAVWVAWWVDYGAAHQLTTRYQAAGVYFVLVIAPFGTVALVALAKLAEVVERLRATRATIAEQAAVSERGRVSRDLHDILGQSLSAIALKSDLALRLLDDDRPAAARQIEDLEQVANELAAETHAVTDGRVTLTTTTEVDRAIALLRAAGIETRLDLDDDPLPPGADALFGWAVREGATNVLRHSNATFCAVTTSRTVDGVFLDIVNDGAREHLPWGGPLGSGIAGLQVRAGALGGRVEAAGAPPDRFRLRVELPVAGR